MGSGMADGPGAVDRPLFASLLVLEESELLHSLAEWLESRFPQEWSRAGLTGLHAQPLHLHARDSCISSS